MNQNLQAPRSTSRDLLIIAGLMVMAFLSRFYGLWQWDLVGDENFTVMHAYERFRSIINPAYYALVVMFFELFGNDAWIARVPALILSVLSVGALYGFWSKTVGRNAALVAALFLLLSAWHLWYAQFARHYMGVFLFGSMAYYYFLSAIITDQVKNLILALVFSFVAILFHATAVWVPASSAVAYLGIWLLHRDNPSVSLRVIKIYMGICAATALAALPFAYFVLREWVGVGETWGYGPIAIIPQLIKYIQIPLVIAAVFGWWLMIAKRPVLATFFALAIGVPMAFLVLAAPFMAISPAYAYYILPLIVILAGVACEEIRAAMSKDSLVFGVFPMVLMIAALLPSFASHYLDRTSLDFETTVEFIEQNYEPGDRILSFVPGFKNKTDMAYDRVPFISFERDTAINWSNELSPLLEADGDTWIIVSRKRRPLAPQLENWLMCHSRLVWRESAVRVDYEVNGYDVFQVQPSVFRQSDLSRCAVNR